VAFSARVAVQLVERVDAHVEHVAVGVVEADDFLLLAPDGDALQAGELTDAEIDVHHVVAGLEVLQGAEREAAQQATPPPGGGAVVAAEDLVVRIDGQTGFGHLEAFVERLDKQAHAARFNFFLKQIVQAGLLAPAVAQDEGFPAAPCVFVQALAEQVQVAVEGGLGVGVPA